MSTGGRGGDCVSSVTEVLACRVYICTCMRVIIMYYVVHCTYTHTCNSGLRDISCYVHVVRLPSLIGQSEASIFANMY